MSAAKNQVPVAKGLFTWPSSDPRLIATRCKSCGDVFFPAINACANPDCGSADMEEILLSKRGKLYSYSIQYYQPPYPYVSPTDPFVPFGIGLVEFPEGVRIFGQMVGCNPEKDLKVGIDVEVVVEPLDRGSQDTEVVAWKFKPVK